LVLAVKSVANEKIRRRTRAKESGDLDDDDVPVFVWKVASSGAVTAITAGSPRLLRRRGSR